MRTRISLALRGGESRVHALRESARGQSQLQQENRVLVRCALESKPQKTHAMRCYLNMKVCILKSTDATSPRGESAPVSVPVKSSRTDARRALCWWAWDVVSGTVLHLSWAPQNSGWKSCTTACSFYWGSGLVLLLLLRAIRIALVLGSVHFEAMLETAPRRWNRVVWRAYPRSYAE